MGRFLPKTLGDRLAFVFAIFGMSYVGLFEFFLVLPKVYSEQSFSYYLHATLGFLLYINCLCWFYKLMSTSSSTEGVILPAVLRPGWRYCSVCESNSPPRAHHCFICDRCVLRRDHHCAFTGNCVGYYNHRYFYLLIANVHIAAMYATFLNFDYTWEMLGGFSPQSIFTMILPFLSYVFGFAEAFTFFCAMSSSFIIMSFLFLTALLVYHGLLIVDGQTMYEKAKHDRQYDLGIEANIVNVFGKNWKYAWLSPWIPSPLPGDGLKFDTRNESEFEPLKGR